MNTTKSTATVQILAADFQSDSVLELAADSDIRATSVGGVVTLVGDVADVSAFLAKFPALD